MNTVTIVGPGIINSVHYKWEQPQPKPPLRTRIKTMLARLADKQAESHRQMAASRSRGWFKTSV